MIMYTDWRKKQDFLLMSVSFWKIEYIGLVYSLNILLFFCQTTIANLKIPQIKDFDIMTISAEIDNGIFSYDKEDAKKVTNLNEISENMIHNTELEDII